MTISILRNKLDVESFQNATSPELTVAAVKTAASKSDWQYRAFDYLFVLLAVPIILPVLLLIAIIVKLDDPRAPVFYRQTRYGKNEKPFQILKIRTMTPGADDIKSTLLAKSEDKGAGFKLEDDPRITRPGRSLRKLYLDELPQFWNVVRGDMSIVGPRANSANPGLLEPWQRLRLLVRPGITGSWQAMRNKPRDFNERCRIDLEYIAQKSLWGDVEIIFRTFLVVAVRPTGC